MMLSSEYDILNRKVDALIQETTTAINQLRKGQDEFRAQLDEIRTMMSAQAPGEDPLRRLYLLNDIIRIQSEIFLGLVAATNGENSHIDPRFVDAEYHTLEKLSSLLRNEIYKLLSPSIVVDQSELLSK